MKKIILTTTLFTILFGATLSHAAFTKICYKDGIGGKIAFTVPTMTFCPLGYKSIR